MDDQLTSFFEKRIAQFRELESLVDEIGRIYSANLLEDKYRNLIERVKAAWEETDRMAKHNERHFAQNPNLRKDPRFRLVQLRPLGAHGGGRSRSPGGQQPEPVADPERGLCHRV